MLFPGALNDAKSLKWRIKRLKKISTLLLIAFRNDFAKVTCFWKSFKLKNFF